MASQYDTMWRSKPTSDWTANGSAESGHNFTEQINEQKANVENAQNLFNEQKGVADTSRQTFQDMFGNQTSYGDYYGQAKESEGVNQAREQYQKSLAAVNGVQSAMTALPSSVNANSGRVLSQSQRQAALANQMNEYNSTLQYWQNQNAGDLSQYQTALSAAQNLAGQQSSEQQQNIATALSDYHTTMNELNNMYNQIINERNVLRQIYGDMYDDEYNHMAQEIEMWATQVQAETQRYAEEQANARNNASIAAQRSLSEYLNSQNQQAEDNSFSSYLLSNAALDQSGVGGWAEDYTDQDKSNYLNDMYYRWNTGDQAERNRIMSGATYQDYLNRIRGAY